MPKAGIQLQKEGEKLVSNWWNLMIDIKKILQTSYYYIHENWHKRR